MPTSPDHVNDKVPAIDSDGGHVALPGRPVSLVRLRLNIAYDGTDFAGWASQTGQRTVAGVVDDALSTVFRVPVQVCAAGRTDSGVHAAEQIAHVDVPSHSLPQAYPRTRRSGESEFGPLVRRLAKLLTEDVRVLEITRAAAGFDARFSALRRHYVYRLSTAPYGVEPRDARFMAAWPRPLDIDAMNSAARELVGLHDFAAFCKRRDGATTIRELQRLDCIRDAHQIAVHVSADAFCWNMVRSLVGALLAVGEHRRDARWCAALLTETRRSSDFSAAPARGLTLVRVDYPPDGELAARNLVTRDLRTAEELS